MPDNFSGYPYLEKSSYCKERKERLGSLSCEECEGLDGCEIRALALFRDLLEGLISGRKLMETDKEKTDMIESIQDLVPILEKWIWGGKFRKVD